jgi:hypothetical protein
LRKEQVICRSAISRGGLNPEVMDAPPQPRLGVYTGRTPIDPRHASRSAEIIPSPLVEGSTPAF